MRSSYGQRGLTPKLSIDPNVFTLERERVFASHWQLIGFENSIVEQGQFFRSSFNGSEVVCIRDKRDRVRVFQNVCRHRGTLLCEEASGCFKTAMTCKYHGWKYGFDGSLVSAPNMLDTAEFEKEKYGLHEIRCATWQGLIFCNASNTAKDLSTFLAPLDSVATRYRLKELQIASTIHYDIDANWKLLFQNFNECYHCPSVHPQLTPLTNYRDAENDFESGPILGGPMKIREGAETISHDGRLCGTISSGLNDLDQNAARYYTIFPSWFLSLFPDYVMIHQLSPVAFNKTRIRCDFLFDPIIMNSKDFDSSKASQFWDETNRQDWEMCERVQIGLTTPDFEPSPYSNLESLLVAFDDYYKSHISEK
jgi:Rieske 2Fe-2S family protein